MRTSVLGLALLLAAAACTPDATDEPTPADGPWRVSEDPVATDGLPRAVDTTVHLADGTTVETEHPIGAYVVAGDGVYYVPAPSDPDEEFQPTDTDAELWYADRDGEVTSTGNRVLASSLSASPNGRYVAWIDQVSGQRDDFGTPQAEAVVWDLERGEEVVRATDGMGDPAADDFAAAYPEADLDIALLADTTAYVDGLGETWAFELSSGDGEMLSDDAEVPAYDPLSRVSPDGTWTIRGGEQNQVIVGQDGRRVEPQMATPRWTLLGWVDDRTVYGVAEAGEPTLKLCTVPQGRCRELVGTAGEQVIFPQGRLATDRLDLRGTAP